MRSRLGFSKAATILQLKRVEIDQRLLLGTGHGWFLFVSLYGRNAGFLLDSCVLAEEQCASSRQDRLLLGEQIAKDIFHPLPELEVLVRIQDQGLHECLGLLTTRFPNGFDGQAPFRR